MQEAGGTHASSPVTVDKPLPSLDDTDNMLLLNQHGELSGRLKYVFTLQDDIPLWRERGDSEFQMSGLNAEVLQRSAQESELLLPKPLGFVTEGIVTFCCLSAGET